LRIPKHIRRKAKGSDGAIAGNTGTNTLTRGVNVGTLAGLEGIAIFKSSTNRALALAAEFVQRTSATKTTRGEHAPMQN
jgi:hypothetical protein